MERNYQIVVKGHLDRRYAGWLEGYSLELGPDGQTILSGEVPDQAALYGLLLRMRDLGITLISVKEINQENLELKDGSDDE